MLHKWVENGRDMHTHTHVRTCLSKPFLMHKNPRHASALGLSTMPGHSEGQHAKHTSGHSGASLCCHLRLEGQRATDFIRVCRVPTSMHRLQFLSVQALLAAAIYSYIAKMKMPRLPDMLWLCLTQELKLGWHGLD